MPIELPTDPSPNAMLVASLVLVVLLLVVFFRKSIAADRLIDEAERRAQAEAARADALEAASRETEAEPDRDDVLHVLDALPSALRTCADATTREAVAQALGGAVTRLLGPEQWMVFADVEGDGTQYQLLAAASENGGTWPIGACLTPQMGRVGLVIRRKRAMDRTDLLAEPPIVRSQVEESEPGVFRVDVAVPVLVRDQVVGALAVGGSKLPSDATRAVLRVVAEHAAVLHQLSLARQRAVRLENLDVATDMHNRDWFTAQGAELMFAMRDHPGPISCAVFGIDDFRIYAGREGPARTRLLLRRVADLVRPLFRDGELLCRWGECEFAALLPARERGEACEILDRVRHAVATTPFEGAENQPEGAVTLSVGLAASPDDGRTFDALVDHAYRAYLTSRKRGGDRTSGEVAVDEEFLDVVSGLAEETPLSAPGSSDS